MQTQNIAIKQRAPGMRLIRNIPATKLGSILFYVFFVVTVTAVFIPLNPRMPGPGLDASWQFAMNAAVARHMRFGKEIIFTYGPYASVCTRTYSPATDLRMMLGSLLLAVSYVAALLFLAGGRKRLVILTLLLFLATFGASEQLLLSYAFLLVVCALKHVNSDVRKRTAAINLWQAAAIIVMVSTLGLLPVVKGSLLLPFAASAAVSSALFLYRGWMKLALLMLALPLTAAAALWIIAGQSLADLVAFLRGTIALTSGYTDAMSTPWGTLPPTAGAGLVIAFLTATGLVCLSIARASQLTAQSKWMMALLVAVFGLVAFKHGFVAATAVTSAFASLVIVILIVTFLHVDRYLICSLSIALLLTIVTSVTRDAVLVKEVHERFGVGAASGGGRRGEILAFGLKRALGAYPRTTYISTWNTYSGAWRGIRSRLTHGELENSFLKAEAGIRDAYAVPSLNGTVDIYEVDQSFLLASKNEWNPRPIIQSYSAYTPYLTRLNEQHLRDPTAPDWLLFDLDTIDDRLPSLDDGSSWPALIDNYAFVSYDGHFVLLRKNRTTRTNSSYDNVYEETCTTGSTVTLPDTDGLMFAEVDLNPTIAGRVLAALFNPPQLHIVLGLASGKTKTYRVVSEMMKTDFLLSPLVSDTNEFASLMAGSGKLRMPERVQTISIAPSYGGALFWSDSYELKVKKYRGY
jgi:hypothetical protein